MRKQIGLFMTIGLMLVILGACSPAEEVVQQEEEEQAIPVEIMTAEKGQIEEGLRITGDVAANKEVSVTPKLAGKVTQIYVKKGDIVQEGQKLAQLEQTDLINSIRQAEAAVESAKANLENAKAGRESGIVQATEQINNSLLALQNAQISYDNAKANYERTKSLYEAGAVPKQQFEQAETSFQQAEVGLDQAQVSVRLAEESLASAERTENIKTLEASLKQAQASLDTARSQLENSVITAPMSGEITSIAVEVGEMASPQAPFMHIVQNNPLLIKAKISEEQLRLVEKGQELDIYIRSAGEQIKATIRYISSVPEENSRLYALELEVADAPSSIHIGMIAEIYLQPLATLEEAILIPIGAVKRTGTGSTIYVVEGDRAVLREVETGNENTNLVEIVSGLTEGEQVVVKGQSRLTDNALVRIAEGR